MITAPLTVRVFLSSPSDVLKERNLARKVMKDLESSHLLRDKVHFEILSWDDPQAATPFDVRESPQESVSRFAGRPADCDLTLIILWGRIGTPVPSHLARPDGFPYQTGTIWEYEDAKANNKTVFVYRRTSKPQIDLDDPDFEGKRAQYEGVKTFFSRLANANGSLSSGFNSYKSSAAFSPLLRQHLEAFVKERLGARAAFSELPLSPDDTRVAEILKSIDELGRKIDQRDKKVAELGPNLVPVNVSVAARALIAVGSREPHAFVYCANVLFRNDPGSCDPTAEAPSVLGQITFLNHRRPVLTINTARWGDTDQPAVRKARNPFASLIDLNTVPFRIGESHELNVAIKHPNQAHFYAFDNSTYDHSNWENPAFRLDGDTYEVVVRLRGVHLDQEHRFKLINLGAGAGLTIEPISDEDTR